MYKRESVTFNDSDQERIYELFKELSHKYHLTTAELIIRTKKIIDSDWVNDDTKRKENLLNGRSARHCFKWSVQEETQMSNMLKDRHSFTEIAEKLERGYGAITARFTKTILSTDKNQMQHEWDLSKIAKIYNIKSLYDIQQIEWFCNKKKEAYNRVKQASNA